MSTPEVQWSSSYFGVSMIDSVTDYTPEPPSPTDAPTGGTPAAGNVVRFRKPTVATSNQQLKRAA